MRRDLVDYVSELQVVKDLGGVRFADGLEVDERVEERYSSRGDDYGNVRGEVTATVRFRRPDHGHDATAVTRTVQTSDATDFHLHARLDAYRGDVRIASLNWRSSVPRDLV